MPNPRRRPPVPAQLAFAARRDELSGLPLDQRFSRIFATNLWTGTSRSGIGSELASTAGLRAQLPALLERLDARSLLDIPCGDFGWLSTVALALDYTGADIVADLIAANERAYGGPLTRRRFVRLDLTSDPLPAADIVLCRDCLVHLSFAHIAQAFDNLRRSGSTWLLTTTFLDHDVNVEIESGDWRMLNLTRPPFNLPEPEAILIEGCAESDGAYSDKALGLWRLADITWPCVTANRPQRPR
jgi:hypothetical protein